MEIGNQKKSMNDLQIFINKDNILRLKYLKAIQPTQVHVKADHLYFIFRLYKNDQLFDQGYFSSTIKVFETQQILVLEEFDLSILDNENIKTDQDVKLNLRLFDFNTNQTGNFSSVSGGSFSIKQLKKNKIIYLKHKTDLTAEFEVNIDQIVLRDFN